jgi:hypothetical protein
MDVVETAWRLADDLLFPAALETDRCDVVPIDVAVRTTSESLSSPARTISRAAAEASSRRTCSDRATPQP